HEYHVQHDLTGQADGLFPVTGLARHLDVALSIEQDPEPGPDQGLVVDEQYPDHSLPSRRSVTVTQNPPPGRSPACSSPPSAATRSRMPAIPLPPGKDRPSSHPRPSSSTCTMRSCSP